ncbi:hypothetical protein AYO44_04835 [Planctomycetaceae bacterium SCGC AG-212-F19]|nr:hypothetical protein AYO44_04835 [Planctomycetaceae bacterium SCGC AG-212-F19]
MKAADHATARGRAGAAFVLGLAALTVLAGQAAAADVDQREFAVQVDGKPAGTYQLTIVAQDDGTTTTTAAASIGVKIGPFTAYSYTYRGTETWKDGQLVRMDSSANDNGKRLALAAVSEPNGIRVTVNGQQGMHPRQAWTTSYWRLLDARFRGPKVPLLDADTGRALQAQFTQVGVDQVSVLGKHTPCGHFRLGGDVQVDLWYDGSERLVRQESLEDGHKTVLELTRYQRTPR